MTENEMVRWHHRFDGREFEETPGDGDGQRSLACCSSRGLRESDGTWRLKQKSSDTYRELRVTSPQARLPQTCPEAVQRHGLLSCRGPHHARASPVTPELPAQPPWGHRQHVTPTNAPGAQGSHCGPSVLTKNKIKSKEGQKTQSRSSLLRCPQSDPRAGEQVG